MGSEESERDVVVTQISFGGFDGYMTAKTLLDYFEQYVGIVLRCRLKTSSTPFEAYLEFAIDTTKLERLHSYENLIPHAFVHFVTLDAARSALDDAGCGELILDNNPLKISLGPHRNKEPFKLPDVVVEIGSWVSKDKFFVGWRGPATGVDFLVDPFDGTCKFVFTMDTVFSFPGMRNHVVIKCNLKVEFLVRDIQWIKDYNDSSYLIILLHLESSPKLYYRTVDDDIEDTFPFDILDNDDPKIRTTDITASGAIGRCNIYRILIKPRHRDWLLKNPKLLRTRELDDFVEVRRLIITPTRAYCLPPEVELSNRVLRHYRSVADRFLRVTFMDDGMQTIKKKVFTYYPAPIVSDNTSNVNAQETSVFKRVKDITNDGFHLCGRKYSFLAFSANQPRDRSAWFFSGDQNTSVLDVLSWMDSFTNKNVTKYATGMGLCFSSTYATIDVPHDNVDFELADIMRNGNDFSDGIGKISHDL
ncbi:hypothetical protein POM88_023267 [Heracleum sosnowskyi]|uniref:RNA-dependent RNA polymerase n=1 Tax=Heracleum sosnowskyi TaxID=360622 RepID=A0AAD8MUR7_9APIA|nr:hypothetical protein POM88_023267 [Heracleum sosnowskyi]